MLYRETAKELLKHPFILAVLENQIAQFHTNPPDFDRSDILQTLLSPLVHKDRRQRMVNDIGLEAILTLSIQEARIRAKNDSSYGSLIDFVSQLAAETRNRARTDVQFAYFDPEFSHEPVGGDAFTEAVLLNLLRKSLEYWFIENKSPLN